MFFLWYLYNFHNPPSAILPNPLNPHNLLIRFITSLALFRFIHPSASSLHSLYSASSTHPLHPLHPPIRFIASSASSTNPLHRFIASSLHSLYSTSSTLVLHWRHYFICVINSIQNQTPKINDVRIMAILNPFNQSPLTNPITTKRTSVNCTNRTDNRGSLYHFSIYSKLKAL